MMPAFGTTTDDRKRYADFVSSVGDVCMPSPKKRRKANIMNAFQSISLSKTEGNWIGKDQGTLNPPSMFPSLPNLGVEAETQPPDDVPIEDVADGSSSSSDDEDADCQLLSDREVIERKVMHDLVFGPGTAVKKHPVDAKVEEWVRLEAMIRKERAAQQAALEQQQMANQTQDDMLLDHMSVYQTSSLPQTNLTFDLPMRKQRSSSLPGREEVETQMMDIS